MMYFKCIIPLVLMMSCSGAASGLTVEELFSKALQEKGQTYLDIRENILDLAVKDDSFLKEQSQGTDLQSRLLARAILERAEKSQQYQHFEELMIVPITQAIKNVVLNGSAVVFLTD